MDKEYESAVVLVHGTWGRNLVPMLPWRRGYASWTEKDSPLCQALGRNLGRTIFLKATWSGRNSFAERREAAAAIEKEIRKAKDQAERVFVVAHSHGGAALTFALQNAQVAKAVNAAVFLSTPFISSSESSFDPSNLKRLSRIISLLAGVLFAFICSVAFVHFHSSATSAAQRQVEEARSQPQPQRSAPPPGFWQNEVTPRDVDVGRAEINLRSRMQFLSTASVLFYFLFPILIFYGAWRCRVTLRKSYDALKREKFDFTVDCPNLVVTKKGDEALKILHFMMSLECVVKKITAMLSKTPRLSGGYLKTVFLTLLASVFVMIFQVPVLKYIALPILLGIFLAVPLYLLAYIIFIGFWTLLFTSFLGLIRIRSSDLVLSLVAFDLEFSEQPRWSHEFLKIENQIPGLAHSSHSDPNVILEVCKYLSGKK